MSRRPNQRGVEGAPYYADWADSVRPPRDWKVGAAAFKWTVARNSKDPERTNRQRRMMNRERPSTKGRRGGRR